MNDFSTEEYTYINVLEKWFGYEREFLDSYLELINTGNKEQPINLKSNYLSTLNASFSKIQLEGLRVLLRERLYISEISNDDFLYLFQSMPIVPSMIKLDWLKPNSWCHYMLKEIVFVGINFNFKQVNNCIIGFEGKKFDSNSNKKADTKKLMIS
ncbi:MAG: hypothetical protein IPF54_21760 [Draconibacterium sp.]|nr:hypothetical protein [Draconibacterium sp.]